MYNNFFDRFQPAGSQQIDYPPIFARFSTCTGRKRALTIGINYIGQTSELRGCINDSNNIKSFLRNKLRYKREDIIQLIDSSPYPQRKPTRANIMDSMYWLVHDAQPGDQLFFHFSGHGSQVVDTDGDEVDGMDEAILPFDYRQNGKIVDDDMNSILVRCLPSGCRLTALFDCCHSGSALDLPYTYSKKGKLKKPRARVELAQEQTSYSKIGSSIRAPCGLPSEVIDRIHVFACRTRSGPADVVSWSGCRDMEQSQESNESNRPVGLMTSAFIEALTARPQQTYQELLAYIRHIMREHPQRAQLSCSHPLDTRQIYVV